MSNTNKIKKITYIFPSRSRPQKFFATLHNIRQLSAQNNYEIIAVLDSDDATMNNQEVKDGLMQYPNVKPFYGISRGKVDAINRELSHISTDTDIVCLQSDDMTFIKEGFDLDIIQAYEDGFNGLAHFPDQVQGKRLCTYSIMHIDYLRFFKYIYNPKYNSLYVDDEQQEVAKKINKYKFVDKQIFEHRHHKWGYKPDGTKETPGVLAIPDDLAKLRDSDAVYEEDRKKYFEFKSIIVATSLSPGHFNNSNQLQALKSWQRIAPCYSLNSLNEIQRMKSTYDNISFVETTKVVQDLIGKPLVNVNAMFDLAMEKQKDLLLLNSDIVLDNLPPMKDDGITVYSRYDYETNIFESTKFEAGFDVFFIPYKFLHIFPPSIYALGACWWDYFIPYRVIIANIPLYYADGKYAYHKKHPLQYNPDEWEHLGRYFQWEFRLRRDLEVGQVATAALANIKSRLRKNWQ